MEPNTELSTRSAAVVVDGLTKWAVPPGYCGGHGAAFETPDAVPMVRLDDLVAALAGAELTYEGFTELVQAFKAAWHEADLPGNEGNRTSAGLYAVLSLLGYTPPQAPAPLGVAATPPEVQHVFINDWLCEYVEGSTNEPSPLMHVPGALAQVRGEAISNALVEYDRLATPDATLYTQLVEDQSTFGVAFTMHQGGVSTRLHPARVALFPEGTVLGQPAPEVQ